MEPLVEDPPQRTPIAEAPLSVILLAIGATSEAAECLGKWQEYLATLNRPFELLVLPLVQLEPNPILAGARCLEFDPGRGFGSSLHAAYLAVQHPLVVLVTADWQYQAADLARLLGVIDHVDIAVGCRTVAPRWWWWRAIRLVIRCLGWVLIGLPLVESPCTPGATPWQRRWVARWLFGVRLTDPESAMRLGRREALTRIMLQSRGPFALVEQLAKANHLEMIMTEEPVSWSPVPPTATPAASFAQEARALLFRPDFGPPELHGMPPPGLPAEKPASPPTTPPSPSSERKANGN
jgi:hypothetical protein